MAVSLHYGRRLAGQTLRMIAGNTHLTGCALKSTSLISSFPYKLNILCDNSHRSFSNSASYGSPRNDLMDYPRIVPTLLGEAISNLKSQFFQNYIISRYDKDFTLESFEAGAEGAFIVVSEILASDDISSLKDNGLVEASAFREIKANHERMGISQRRQLRINEDQDIQTHIHEVSIIEDDESGLKALEIMVVFFVIDFDDNIQDEDEDEVIICNYRFYRDYTNASNPSSWIINIANHFRAEGQELF